jgi:hypothetical protein
MHSVIENWHSWAWPLAALVAVSLHLWFPETPTGSRHDSYSAAADGHKAFYRLVAQQPANQRLTRNRVPLASLVSALPPDATLCILGPERPPAADEWSALVDWIRNGGSLLYAFRGDKRLELPWLKVTYRPEAPPGDRLEPTTRLVDSSQLAWWSDGRLDAPNGLPLVFSDDTLQAAVVDYGFGRAVFVASPLPFSNQLLTYGDNSVLAVRLLEAAGPLTFVTFDESLNSTGTAKVVGILFDPLLRPITIQVAILAVLYGWWQSRRFGPLTPSAVTPRQNIVEHTDMVGNWYWKSRDGRGVLKAYLRQLTAELRWKSFKGKEDLLLEPIARRSGRDVAALRKDLQQAFAAVRSNRVERRTAARLIRRMALIRRAARPVVGDPSKSRRSASASAT